MVRHILFLVYCITIVLCFDVNSQVHAKSLKWTCLTTATSLSYLPGRINSGYIAQHCTIFAGILWRFCMILQEPLVVLYKIPMNSWYYSIFCDFCPKERLLDDWNHAKSIGATSQPNGTKALTTYKYREISAIIISHRAMLTVIAKTLKTNTWIIYTHIRCQ